MINSLIIRIEASDVPDASDVQLLYSVLKDRVVHVAIDYRLADQTAERIFKTLSTIHSNKLLVFYDSCMICKKDDDASSLYESFSKSPIIPKYELMSIRQTCGAGTNKFFVDKLGRVFPCYRMRNMDEIASITSTTPVEFINRIEAITSQINSNCHACTIRYFCGKGCKAEWNINTIVTHVFSPFTDVHHSF